MEPTIEGASDIREKINAKSNELKVQVLLDIDPSKSLDEKENIYRQTLEFLESLNDEEKLKLKKSDAILIEDLNSLEEVKNKIGRKEEIVAENTPQEEQGFKFEQIDGELLKKLNDAGIKTEIVEALMNLAMYDENEKTLMIRQDADAEHVNDYIKDIVFREPDEVGSPTENGEPFVEQHFDYDKKDKDEGDNEGESGIGEEPQPEVKPEPAPETKKPLSKWNELNSLLMDLNIDLEFNEEQFAKFEEKGLDKAEEKYNEIREAIESFSNKNNLKEIFSTIRLGYPRYEGNSKIFIEDNILFIDLGINKQEIIDFFDKNITQSPVSLEIPPEQAEVPPEPITPEPAPVVLPENVPPAEPSQVEKIPTNEEWEEFVKLRNDLAKTEAKKGNFSIDSGISVENLKLKYVSDKEKIAGLIRKEQHKILGEGPLTEEQERSLNDYLFEELVKKENDVYLNVLRANRKETWKDKTIETAKNLLGTKAVKWYLSLSRSQRMALSFGVGSIAGLAAGVTVAPGIIGLASYLGWRAARVGLSGTAGVAAGEWANKKWSAEELKKAEEKETEDLKNSQLSLEEKSKGLLDIEKRYKKERIKMTLKKVGTTIAAGAGTGFLTGLAEHAVMGAGGAARSVLESKGGKTGTVVENKLPPRKGFEPATKPKPLSITEQAQPAKPSALEQTPAAPKIFSDPSVLKHEVVAGDSTWKILNKTLENNDQFKGMTEAQKTYVLSAMTNKVMQNPGEYGIGKDGFLAVHDKTDFTKLFENTKIKEILDKAHDTIKPGSSQESSIIGNNAKIASWVKENPNVKLTNDKVADILATKPKVEVAPEPIPAPEVSSPEPLPQDILTNSPYELESRTMFAGGAVMAGTAALNSIDEYKKKRDVEQTHMDIAKAKGRLTELEALQARDRNPNLERSFASDSKLFVSNVKFNQKVEEAFKNDIDQIYGKKGLLGVGKVAGINTKEGKKMLGRSAKKIVEYRMGDSAKSGLSPGDMEEITKSRQDNIFMDKVLVDLMEKTKGVIKPFENEDVGTFIKRLGAQALKRAA